MERKRNACSECYRLKKTCKYEVNAQGNYHGSCQRCRRLQKCCIPRIVIRKARSSKTSKQLSRRDSADSSPGNNEISSEEAYASLGLAIDEQDSEHFVSASIMCKLYQQLGSKEAPPFLRALTKLLLLMAKKQRSVSRLHAATCLALSTGTFVDLNWLNDSENLRVESGLLERATRSIVDSKLKGQNCGAAMVIRHDAGARDVFVNDAFSFFFESAAEVTKSARDSRKAPHVQLPAKYIQDSKTHKEFFGQSLVHALRDSICQPFENVKVMQWENDTQVPVTIVDREGLRFQARLFECGLMEENGRFAFFVFAFKDMVPLEQASRVKMASFMSSKTADPANNSGEFHFNEIETDSASASEASCTAYDPSQILLDEDIAAFQSAGMVNPNDIAVWENLNLLIDDELTWTS